MSILIRDFKELLKTGPLFTIIIGFSRKTV